MSYIKYRANKDAEWQELNSPVNIVLQGETPTDNRTNLSYWYQYLNADYNYDVWEWDEEWNSIYPEDNIDNWLMSIDYPVGTHNVTDFCYFYAINRLNNDFMMTEDISIPTIKFNGVLDMSNGTQQVNGIGIPNHYTEDVGTIIFPTSGVGTHAFYNYYGLKHIRVKGKIYGDVSFPNSPLTYESIMSIVNALDDNVTGKKVRFNAARLDECFPEDDWMAIVDSKPNWTFVW